VLGYILKLHLIWKKNQINIFLVLFNNFDVIILKIKKSKFIFMYFQVINVLIINTKHMLKRKKIFLSAIIFFLKLIFS